MKHEDPRIQAMLKEVEDKNKKLARDNPGMVEFMRNNMKEQMERADRVPLTLYHASPSSNRSKILKKGLEAHELYGMVNTCETAEQARAFVNGDVWEITTEMLDDDEFYMSEDHSRAIWNFDVWAYFGDIPKKYIRRL